MATWPLSVKQLRKRSWAELHRMMFEKSMRRHVGNIYTNKSWLKDSTMVALPLSMKRLCKGSWVELHPLLDSFDVGLMGRVKYARLPL